MATWSPSSQDVAPSLPGVAQARIQHQAEPGSAPISFMPYSDHLLFEDAGLEPISGVIGLSVVHAGQLQLAGLNQPVELEAYSRSLTMGWSNALSRLQQEADLLGADGVYLQHTDAKTFDAEEHEFSFRGTALRFRPRPGALRTPSGAPFVCSSSAQLLYQMLRRGLVPVTVRYDVCVYHVPHRTLRQTLGQTFQNTEVPVFTEGWYTAREIALSRMQTGLEQAGSELILAANVEEFVNVFGEHTAECRAFGRGWRRMAEVRDLVSDADLTVTALIDRDGLYPSTLIDRADTGRARPAPEPT